MRRKAGSAGNGVVVEDAQRAPVDVVGIDVVGKTERMIGIEPAVIGVDSVRRIELIAKVGARVIGVMPSSTTLTRGQVAQTPEQKVIVEHPAHGAELIEHGVAVVNHRRRRAS